MVLTDQEIFSFITKDEPVFDAEGNQITHLLALPALETRSTFVLLESAASAIQSLLTRQIKLIKNGKYQAAVDNISDLEDEENPIDPHQTYIFKYLVRRLKLEQNQIMGNLENINLLLSGVMQSIKEQLEKLKQKIVEKTFGQLTDENSSALKKYVEITQYIARSHEVDCFKKKLYEICNNSKNKRELGGIAKEKKGYSPFAFICASSATGKTNMAFSLGLPFLYFLFSTASTQAVYGGFTTQSQELMNEVLKEDLNTYLAGLRAEERITILTVEKVARATLLSHGWVSG